MLDKLKGNKKNSKDTPPDLRKPDEESGDVGGKIKDLVGKMSGKKMKRRMLRHRMTAPVKCPDLCQNPELNQNQ